MSEAQNLSGGVLASAQKIDRAVDVSSKIFEHLCMLDNENDRRELMLSRYANFFVINPVVSMMMCSGLYDQKAMRMMLNKAKVSMRDAQCNYLKYYHLCTSRDRNPALLNDLVTRGTAIYEGMLNVIKASTGHSSDENIRDMKNEIRELVYDTRVNKEQDKPDIGQSDKR